MQEFGEAHMVLYLSSTLRAVDGFADGKTLDNYLSNRLLENSPTHRLLNKSPSPYSHIAYDLSY